MPEHRTARRLHGHRACACARVRACERTSACERTDSSAQPTPSTLGLFGDDVIWKVRARVRGRVFVRVRVRFFVCLCAYLTAAGDALRGDVLLSGQVAAGADDGRRTVRLSKGKEAPALSLVCPGGGLSRRNLAAAVRSLALKAKGSVNAYGPDFATFVMAPKIPFDLFDSIRRFSTLRSLRFFACAYVSVATALAFRQYLPNDATRISEHATYPWRYAHAIPLTARSHYRRPSRGSDRSSQQSRARAD